jgi:hypothetical protein
MKLPTSKEKQMYVKVENNEVAVYPYAIQDLKKENPKTSFPKVLTDDLLSSYGIYKVVYGTQPSINEATHKIVADSQPSLVRWVRWTISFTSTALSASEQAAADEDASEKNRRTRNDRLLIETDFYALSDVTMSAEMTAYRQALRDITAHANWPHLNDEDWPTKP